MKNDRVKPNRLKKFLIRVGALLGFAFLLAAVGIVWDGLHDDIGNADVAIVLGNAVKMDGTPSPRLQARLDKTVELYQQGLYKNIIVSGGTGVDGINEADVMKQYLLGKDIPEDRILVDKDGANTYLTAKNAARLMRENQWTSAMVISQYFHISRSRLALKRFGVSPVYSAHAHYFEVRDFYSTTREVFGYCAYLFRNYSDS